MPAHCPECASAVVRLPDGRSRCTGDCSVPRSATRRCCTSQAGALDIEGLGEKLVDQLVDGDRVPAPADVYKLVVEDLAGRRMAEKSAGNLVAGIGRANPTLARFVYALGIRHVGEATARISRAISASSMIKPTSAVLDVNDVGPVLAESIAGFFASPIIAVIAATKAGVDGRKPSRSARRGTPHRIDVVRTGTLPTLARGRQGADRGRGGKVAGSVSANDYVVAGATPASSRAQALGVPVLDEAGLWR
jgi:DNA ligase (NAD+)